MRRVLEVMTRDVEVVEPNASLKEAAEKMRRFNVGPVPVCEGDKLVGLVTDRDIVVRGIAMGHDPNTSKISSVMTEDLETIQQNASLDAAVKMMKDKQIRRLLVVDDDHKLVGILSLGDLAHETDEATSARTLEQISKPSQPAY